MTQVDGVKKLRFWQVDAFSAQRYKGNPAAIVFEADLLSSDEMQTIARQMNLSETVFLCRPSPGADYHARIFTPAKEIPFAGHPTIAAAFAHTATTASTHQAQDLVLRQQCGVGTISVAVTEENEGRLFALTSKAEPTLTTRLTREQIAELIDVDAQDVADEPAEICSIGLPWLIARLRTLNSLRSATPDLALIEHVCREHEAIGITLYCLEAQLEDCSVHVRTFAPGAGITEDPVCGSGNGAIAVHLARHSYRDSTDFSYRAEQGLEIHRRGVLHLSVDRASEEALSVRLGGQAVKVLEGDLWI